MVKYLLNIANFNDIISKLKLQEYHYQFSQKNKIENIE
jgi:hypothetical protein